MTNACIVVARARPGRSELAERLRTAGADVVERPRLRAQFVSVDAASLRNADILIVGCAESATALACVRTDTQVIAVGQRAARTLATHGKVPVATTQGACRDALSLIAEQVRGADVIVLASSAGRPAMCSALTEFGARVRVVMTHEIQELAEVSSLRSACDPLLGAEPIWFGDAPRDAAYAMLAASVVALPSSSAVKRLYRMLPHLVAAPAVAIGPRTAAAARAHGVDDVSMTVTDTIKTLADATLAVHRRVRHAFMAGMGREP